MDILSIEDFRNIEEEIIIVSNMDIQTKTRKSIIARVDLLNNMIMFDVKKAQ